MHWQRFFLAVPARRRVFEQRMRIAERQGGYPASFKAL
jgi:hypothetical protein